MKNLEALTLQGEFSDENWVEIVSNCPNLENLFVISLTEEMLKALVEYNPKVASIYAESLVMEKVYRLPKMNKLQFNIEKHQDVETFRAINDFLMKNRSIKTLILYGYDWTNQRENHLQLALKNTNVRKLTIHVDPDEKGLVEEILAKAKANPMGIRKLEIETHWEGLEGDITDI